MGALSHIRVLDLTRVLAGPWCAQTLADFGADVIKVERPGAGDDTRHWGPPYLKTPDGADTREAAYYLAANRNKRSVTVDIATPEGQQIVRELAAQSDVVLENYKVGQLKKYGLDYESLKAVKADIVYCSVTGFGQTGPYAQRAGYDFIVQGIGGFMSITGERDGQPGGGPQKAGVAIADLMTGMYSSVAVLTALAHRDRTGEGQYIDMALLDVQVAMLANMNSNFLTSGKPPARWGTPIRTSFLIRRSRRATAGSSSRWATTGSSASSSKRASARTSPTTSALPPIPSACEIARRSSRSSRRWSVRAASTSGSTRSKRRACPAGRSTIWKRCSRTSRWSRVEWRFNCRIHRAAR